MMYSNLTANKLLLWGIGLMLFAAVLLTGRQFLVPSQYPHYDALVHAIERKDVNAVKAELDKGTDPNIFPNDSASMRDEDDISALNIAADEGDYEIVKILLDHRANPDMGDGWHEDPLAAATNENHTDVMLLLIERGARVNDDQSGSRALWRAAMDGHTKSVSFLLAHGANPNTSANTSIKSERLLHAIKSTAPLPEIIALLKKAGARE